MKKICYKCKIEKELCEFHKNKYKKDGYNTICKECRKIKSKDDYFNNKNKDKIIINKKICSTCFFEKDISCFHKQIGCKYGYRSECKECRGFKFKNKYKNDIIFSVEHRKRTKKYAINNREKINKYFNQRYLNKPYEYAWRGMLNSVIRRLGGKKELTTYEALGYSALDLKEHIEKKFKDGMSWDNWGEWHIDHIKPISKFDKNTDPKIVNSLQNLQPLWSYDNIRKSNN